MIQGGFGNSIGSTQGLQQELDAKLDAAIGFTALADNTTAINLASFAGKAGVTITYTDGLNKSLTLADDLKDGRERAIRAINTHGSINIAILFPTPYISFSSGAGLPFGLQTKIYFRWDDLQSSWEIKWDFAESKVSS